MVWLISQQFQRCWMPVIDYTQTATKKIKDYLANQTISK